VRSQPTAGRGTTARPKRSTVTSMTAVDGLAPPPDPRDGWDLPPPGGLPQVADLDPRTTRVLAPNPGPMTLDGTNTYVVGEVGSGEAVVVDPGPDTPAHRAAVEEVLARRDAACVLVLVTHHHLDHSAAARPWGEAFGCPVAAPTPDIASAPEHVLRDGRTVRAGGVTVEAVATPGHSGDHVCFRLDHGPLLTGDHVLGRGTSMVGAPDGDLAAYLGSLRRVLDLGPDALYPGHGPELHEDPPAVIRFYLDHRRFRERQILRLLEDGPLHATEIVRRIYVDVDERLLPAAARSTRAALTKLAADGRVALDAGGTASLRAP
jgi:glyoxylase-like metal-dependent hydrolase (beta-lactamase superfamily II)